MALELCQAPPLSPPSEQGPSPAHHALCFAARQQHICYRDQESLNGTDAFSTAPTGVGSHWAAAGVGLYCWKQGSTAHPHTRPTAAWPAGCSIPQKVLVVRFLFWQLQALKGLHVMLVLRGPSSGLKINVNPIVLSALTLRHFPSMCLHPFTAGQHSHSSFLLLCILKYQKNPTAEKVWLTG